MILSGVVSRTSVQTEFDDEEDSRVTLIVHNMKPPFLDGRVSFTRQSASVQVVADPTSDIAQLARAGSAVLKTAREARERTKMRARFWELGGSRMGKAMGLKEEEGDGEKTTQNMDEEARDVSKNFAESFKFGQKASGFSRTRSLWRSSARSCPWRRSGTSSSR